jgi:hypothetical protein
MGKTLIASTVFAVLSLAPPARALNWEGHEDFFHEKIPIPELVEGIERPAPKPLPTCDLRKAKTQANPYEQQPLPGKNCIEVDSE